MAGRLLNIRLITKTFTRNHGTLKLSESCVKRLEKIANGKPLRVFVEGGGCSGFQYKFSLDDKDVIINKDDVVFGDDKAKVVVDETSLEYIDGSVVDYHTELIKSSFVIVNNPKADNGCSCGSSFSLKV